MQTKVLPELLTFRFKFASICYYRVWKVYYSPHRTYVLCLVMGFETWLTL